MSTPGVSNHHNTSRRHKNKDGKKRFRSSNSSSASNETPLKRAKDILSPNVFELLDGYDDTCTKQTLIENKMAEDTCSDTTLLLNRVLQNINTLANKVDSYHVQAKDSNTRLSAIESAFSGIDVKLDINNKLLHSVCDSIEYTPERCVIISTIPYENKENILQIVQNIFSNGLNLTINIVRVKRLNGLNENGYYKSGSIMVEMRYVEDRIHVLRFKYRLRNSHIRSMNNIYIRPAQSALESNVTRYMRSVKDDNNYGYRWSQQSHQPSHLAPPNSNKQYNRQQWHPQQRPNNYHPNQQRPNPYYQQHYQQHQPQIRNQNRYPQHPTKSSAPQMPVNNIKTTPQATTPTSVQHMDIQQTQQQVPGTSSNGQTQQIVHPTTSNAPILHSVNNTSIVPPSAAPTQHLQSPSMLPPVQSMSNQDQQVTRQQPPPNIPSVAIPTTVYQPQQATTSQLIMNTSPVPQTSHTLPTQQYTQHQNLSQQTVPVMSPSITPNGFMTSSSNHLPNSVLQQTMAPHTPTPGLQHNMNVHQPQPNQHIQATHIQPMYPTSSDNPINTGCALSHTAQVMSNATNVLYKEQYCNDYPSIH